MIIKSIAAKALKGHNFKRTLDPITVITGPNDIGKTSIADACRLVLLGYLPGLPKTNQGVFALSGAATMAVAAKIEHAGTTFDAVRTWVQKGQTIKATEEGTAQIPAFAVAMLDPAEFFGKSDAQQTEMLFGLLDMSGSKITTTTVQAGMRAIDPREEPDLPTGPDETVQAFIARMLDLQSDRRKAANANLATFTKTAQGITTLGATEEMVNPDQVEKDLEAAEKRHRDLIAEFAKAQETSKAQEEIEGRRRRISAQIDGPASSFDLQPGADVAATREYRDDQVREARNEVNPRLGAQRAVAAEAPQGLGGSWPPVPGPPGLHRRGQGGCPGHRGPDGQGRGRENPASRVRGRAGPH